MWRWVLLGVILVMILAFASCMAAINGAVNAVDTANAPATVRYELVGDGRATTVTYSTAGGTSQESEVTLPWSSDTEFQDSLFAPATLTAQRGEGDGTLTCRITNLTTGGVIAESTSSGQYAVVTCSGPVNDGP